MIVIVIVIVAQFDVDADVDVEHSDNCNFVFFSRCKGYYLWTIGTSSGEIVLAYFDQLTNAIPVTLVICLIISTWLASWRLKEIGIFVSDSSRLNMAGLTTVTCFDKTGSCHMLSIQSLRSQ